jgi:hypothetical protein
VLARLKKAANLAWGRVRAGNAEPMFQMFDCLPNLIEIIGYRRSLPRYSCLISGQCHVEPHAPPDMLTRIANAGEKPCKLLDHSLPGLNLLTRPTSGSRK